MFLFKHTTENCCKVAALQFVVFLIVFLVPSYLSLFIEIKKNISGTMKVNFQFEKYALMALSLYMIIPLTFSLIFFIGVLHKNAFYILTYIIECCFTSIVVFFMTAVGLYIIANKLTCSTGYSLFVIGIFLQLIVTHGIIVASKERKQLRKINDNLNH
ncbi:uncharacterized protein LOC123005627 [Tribolium madens]|uniref:uncharacterized protein LOC123005627 n=1 Tax=Tribolium madens TaxID=41895 RepID=UPI001CF75F73|nr:uncharacterized protein LOC123005627 [Tribolium madens]